MKKSTNVTIEELEKLAISLLQTVAICEKCDERFLPSQANQRNCPAHQGNTIHRPLLNRRCAKCARPFTTRNKLRRNCEEHKRGYTYVGARFQEPDGEPGGDDRA